MDNIGSRVSAFREAMGLKQVDVFRATGIKQQTLSSIESGTEPKSGVIAALLEAYPKLNPDWLLTGQGEMLRDGRPLAPAAKALAPAKSEPAGPQLVQESEYIKELKENLKRAQQDADTWRDLYLGRYTLKEAAAAGKLAGSNHAAAYATKPIGFGKNEPEAEGVTMLTDARLFMVDEQLYFAPDATSQPVRVEVTPIAVPKRKKAA